MSKYTVTYAPPADASLARMHDPRAFKAAMESTLGTDPYG